MSARTAPRPPVGAIPRTLHRGLGQVRDATWTLADAAGLRLAVCPPPRSADCDRDLGTVSRDAFPGETIRVPVRLRNRSGRDRVLSLAADPFRTAADTLAIRPSLTPDTLELFEGQTGLVVIGVEVTDAFTTGLDHVSVVTVSSRCCAPQRLRLRLRVRPIDRAPSFPVCCRER